MKLVHAADLHLDSPLKGLARYEGAPAERIHLATRRAFENLVGLCLDQNASALLLAGDLFDGGWEDYSTGLFFLKQLGRLRDLKIAVYIVRGNHDASSQLTKKISLPDRCYEFSTQHPQTHHNDELGLAIHGQGYATRAVTDDLAATYPDRSPGYLNLGILHTSMDGRPGHQTYAPTTLSVLKSKGYDYWALGHVHTREIVSEDPWVVFPGNLQGRHVRETGDKGATVIEVADGRIVDVAHHALDVVRWARCEVDASSARHADEVIELAAHHLNEAADQAEDRLLAARIVITGASPAHAQLHADPDKWEHELRVHAIDGARDIWIEKVVFETRTPMNLALLSERDDALGQVLQGFDRILADPQALGELAAELADLKKALPIELRRGPDGVDLDNPDALRALLADVEQSLIPRLLMGETD